MGGKIYMKRTTIILLMILLSLTSCNNKYSDTIAPNAEMQTGSDAEQIPKANYIITRVDENIDWGNIPTLPIDKVLWTEKTDITAQGQLCYDNENLYVHLSAVEKEIRAENTEPLSPVYEDSCLEFFFKFDNTDNYFNFEINPNGCLCTQFGPRKTDRINIVREDCAEYFDIKTNRTADGWECYYRIPLRYIRLFYPDYNFGGDITANMYKCGNKTANKHYIAWQPIDLDDPNFHCPEYFGRMRFE